MPAWNGPRTAHGRGVPPPPIALGNRRITLWGQSNAMGVADRSEITASPLSSDAELATFNTTTFSRVYIFNAAGNAYEQLQNGTNNQAFTSAKFGPEFGMAVRWMRETTAGNLYIDKEYGDGQPISYFQSGQAFFTATQARRAAADAWLSSAGISVTNSGWVWVQGETDHAMGAGVYLTALDTLVASMVSAGRLGASERRAIAQITTSSTMYGANVAADKVSHVASNSSTSQIVTYANYLNADNLHLNARGQLQLGYDCMESLFSAPHIAA